MSNEEKLKKELDLIDKFRSDIAELIIKASQEHLPPDSIAAILLLAGIKVSGANSIATLAANHMLDKEKKEKEPWMKPMKMPKGGWS